MEKKAVRVSLEGRSTGKGAYTENFLYSRKQQRKLEPHRSESSRTGNHWESVWFLLPGSYLLAICDISNSGKHNCGYMELRVTGESEENPQGYETKHLEEPLPLWVEPPCDCLKTVSFVEPEVKL